MTTDEMKRDYTQAERDAYAKEGVALADGSYPIPDKAALSDAIHAFGRNPTERVKAHIIKRAKALGAADMLPDDWKSLSEVAVETLITFGSPVKAIGSYKLGGHLVLFTGKNDPDTEDDYYDPTTDFDLEDGDRRTGYYNHGLDVKIGNRKIGSGTLKTDDIGIWLEAQLKDRDEYIDAIWDMVEKGQLGLSSGALSHLVRREQKSNGVNHITHWPIGEWSLTPTPAEPRTRAVPLKSWAQAFHTLDDTEKPTASTYTADDITTWRQMERFLRDAGTFSQEDAKTIISKFKADLLRDVESPRTHSLPPPVKADSPAVQAQAQTLFADFQRISLKSLSARSR